MSEVPLELRIGTARRVSRRVQAAGGAAHGPPARKRTGALAAALLLALAPLAGAGDTTRLSVASDGTQGDNFSDYPALSASARFTAFRSAATNLVEDDTNGWIDIFVRDRKKQGGQTERVSVSTAGVQANSVSNAPDISRSGRFVVFPSFASNLVDDDTNSDYDVFVRDLRKGTTERVSLDTAGGDANGGSTMAVVSASGRFVAFESDATDLVEGDTNGVADVFVRDRKKGLTVRVSTGTAGQQASGGSHSPSLSASGRFVAFESDASDLVEGDTNGQRDVFVKDLKQGTLTRVSLGEGGAEPDADAVVASISASGRVVAFQSTATNLVPGDGNGVADIFTFDLKQGLLRRVSLGLAGAPTDDDSFSPRISARGRFVACASDASNLVEGDLNGKTDIFRIDLKTLVASRASVPSPSLGLGADAESDLSAYNPAISASGRFTAFWTYATNLVPGDTNGLGDVFLGDGK